MLYATQKMEGAKEALQVGPVGFFRCFSDHYTELRDKTLAVAGQGVPHITTSSNAVGCTHQEALPSAFTCTTK
jgi:hypothetical protein